MEYAGTAKARNDSEKSLALSALFSPPLFSLVGCAMGFLELVVIIVAAATTRNLYTSETQACIF